MTDVAQTDCRVYRRHRGRCAWQLTAQRLVMLREWFAVCPVCGDEVEAGLGFYRADTRRSRKTAKDALHRHMIDNHG